MTRLGKKFFACPTLTVAPELLGKVLVRQFEDGRQLRARITEVEAYTAADDPASHAFRGPTPRNQIMFGPAGYLYVYFIYGMYFCANIVCEQEGVAGAVLLRGAVIPGIEPKQTNGPGKLCRVLQISKQLNGQNLLTSNQIWLEDGPAPDKVQQTARIGIKFGQDKLWRFVAKEILRLN